MPSKGTEKVQCGSCDNGFAYWSDGVWGDCIFCDGKGYVFRKKRKPHTKINLEYWGKPRGPYKTEEQKQITAEARKMLRKMPSLLRKKNIEAHKQKMIEAKKRSDELAENAQRQGGIFA